MNIIDFAKEQIRLEARAVTAVAEQLDHSLEEVVELVLGLSGKVLVTGAGTSSFIARRMAHLLSVSGTPALFIHSMDGLHGTMGAVQPSDALIAISKGGESDEVNSFVEAAKHTGCPTVALTEDATSGLADLADIVVTLKTPDEADPGSILAMGSTLAAAVWGDALARTLMSLKDWNLDSSLNLHPAGAVGKLAQRRKGSNAE